MTGSLSFRGWRLKATDCTASIELRTKLSWQCILGENLGLKYIEFYCRFLEKEFVEEKVVWLIGIFDGI